MNRAIATLAGTAIAGAAGIGLAGLVAPDAPESRATTRVVQVGSAHVAVPAGWTRAAPVAGLDPAHTAVLAPAPGLAARVILAFGPADDISLLPRDLRAAVDRPAGGPRPSTLGGYPAITYRGLRSGGQSLDVAVLPTTAGMLAVACGAPAGADYDRSACAREVASVSVPGARALVPSPTIPLAERLPAVVARLDRATAPARKQLAATRWPAGQAAAAARLADRQHAAASELRSTFGTASKPIAAALDEGEGAYDALSRAALAGSPRAFAAARGRIRAAEAGLDEAVGETMRLGTRPSAARPVAPAPGPPPTGDPGIVNFAEMLLVVLVLIGSLVAGFAVSGPLAGAAARRRSAPT